MPIKSPAFQFYVENFIVGTKHFTAEQVGGYILLLCEQWDKGGLPDNDKELLRISRMKIKSLEEVKKKLKKSKKDSLLRNTRLEKERQKKYSWKKKSSLAGIKSGISRRNKKKEIEPTLNQPSDLVEPNTNSSSSISSSPLGVKETPQFSNGRKPIIPTKDKVLEIFRNQGGGVDMAEAFFNKHESTGWYFNGSPIINFVNLVPTFIRIWHENDKNKKADIPAGPPLKRL